ARYFFRLSYPARDLRYGIIEAANGKIGTPVDAIALLCYHYNPVTGKYGLTVLGLVRVFGVATVLGILVGIGIMVGWERMARRRHKVDRSNPPLYNHIVEIVWTGGPLLISLGIYVWATELFFQTRKMPERAMDVYVVGKQSMWKLQHPEGRWEMNELHVPVG